jgi:hypothetical protein
MNLHAAQQACAMCLAIGHRLVGTQLRLQQAWAAHCRLLRIDPTYAASAAAAAAAVATRDSLLELLIGLVAALLALHRAIRRLTNRHTLP